MSDLTNTLQDMARSFGQVEPKRIQFPHCRPGPHRWLEMTKEDFGKKFDYYIIRRGSNTVIDPSSDAALNWLYAHLPENAPRYGGKGYIVESEYINDVLEGMARDGLLSEDDYIYNMAAEERDRHAGEML